MLQESEFATLIVLDLNLPAMTQSVSCLPVAGLGTRFLPATKAMPKEMLTVVDKPLIQYAVEEAAAGITDMIFVTGRNKRAIEDRFDRAYELENELERAGKQARCSTNRRRRSRPTSIASFLRQATRSASRPRGALRAAGGRR